MTKKLTLLIAIVVAISAEVANAADILTPGDPIIAFDFDEPVVNSSYPGDGTGSGEEPFLALDEDPNTKYLNFGKEGTGLIFTPFGPTVAQSLQLVTANDWPARDPDSWELYGTNDAITSPDNGAGTDENWTLISSGAAMLPGGAGGCDAAACTPADARFMPGPLYGITNATSYTSYKVLFPTVKDASIANSMQIADINLYESADGTGLPVGSFFDDTRAVGPFSPDSNYPGPESPAKAIDGLIWDPNANDGMGGSSKYLNFGKENSGFIVTPSAGNSIIDSFEMWVANDSPGRDPADWELYGTNEAIASVDNGQGDGENWTFIDSGTLALPLDRNDAAGEAFSSGVVPVTNMDEYSSYRFVVKTVKDELENSMQFSEIQFFGEITSTPIVCDLDGDTVCDTDDMRVLYDNIEAGTMGGPADIDGSGLVDNADIPAWLTEAGAQNGKVYLTGDTDLDGSVGGNDFTQLALDFGETGLPNAYWDNGNFDGNENGFEVGGPDFTQLALNFGHVSANAVPEPGVWSMWLTALCGLWGLTRWRR